MPNFRRWIVDNGMEWAIILAQLIFESVVLAKGKSGGFESLGMRPTNRKPMQRFP